MHSKEEKLRHLFTKQTFLAGGDPRLGYILLQRDFLLQIIKYLSRTWSNGVHFSVSLCVFVFDGTAVDT